MRLRAGKIAIACAIAGGAALPAAAQMAGTYTGTNNEGQPVQIVVAAGTGGGFVISGYADGGTVFCTAKKSYGYGVGFSGFNTPITGGKAKFDYLSSTVATKDTFKFSGTKVSGTAGFTVPLLLTAKKAAACATKPQTYTATFSGADAAPMQAGAHAWALNKE